MTNLEDKTEEPLSKNKERWYPISYQTSKSITKRVIDPKSIKLHKQIYRGIKQGLNHIKENPISLTYPILGNLSRELQNRIKNATNGRYNPVHAFVCRSFTNIPVYLYYAYISNIGDYPDNSSELYKILCSTIMGGMFSLGEATGGNIICEFVEGKDDNKVRGTASLLGKFASLPIEFGLGIYDAIKNKESKNDK